MTSTKGHPTDVIRAQLVTAAIALEFGIPHDRIFSTTKGPHEVAFARQIGMYLLNVVYDINLTRVARAFSRDRSTAAHACRVIEDSREDPILDRKIIELEQFLRHAPFPHEVERDVEGV